MSQGLSKSEKRMIFIGALVILCFVAFQFLINPMYKSISVLEEEYGALVSQKEYLEAKIQNEPIARAAHESAVEALEGVKARYPEALPNEEIDKLLSSMCLENNLYPVRLGISAGEIRKKAPVESEDGSVVEPEVEQAPAYTTVMALMELDGDYDSLKGLVSEVEKTDYIRITKLTYSSLPDDSGTDNQMSAGISVQFEITMLNNTQDIYGGY